MPVSMGCPTVRQQSTVKRGSDKYVHELLGEVSNMYSWWVIHFPLSNVELFFLIASHLIVV